MPLWYESLSTHAEFLPILPTKAPACSHSCSTTDPSKIRNWASWPRVTGFAAKIAPKSRLVVLDIDSPTKRPDAPDGFLSLGMALQDAAVELPPHPVVATPSGGRHHYFQIPAGVRIRSVIGTWPGVDVLAAGSLAILPGSATHRGEYSLESGDFAEIPELPKALARACRDRQRELKPAGKRQAAREAAATMPKPTGDGPSCISPQERYRLFRNEKFAIMWNRHKTEGDTSDSAYEFHMAKACFCVGLDSGQTAEVIGWWRREHGIEGRDVKKLVSCVIPAAWAEVREWVEEWKAEHRAASHMPERIHTASRRSRTYRRSPATSRVLALVFKHPSWGVPLLARAVGVSYGCVWNILKRYGGEVCEKRRVECDRVRSASRKAGNSYSRTRRETLRPPARIAEMWSHSPPSQRARSQTIRSDMSRWI